MDQARLDKWYMQKAWNCAEKSPDPSTQTGAVVVHNNHVWGIGCNEFPRGVTVNEERLVRPLKYDFIEHAERNAIYQAGIECQGATMYALWGACADCARGIIQSGIVELVAHRFYLRDEHDISNDRKNWSGSISTAFTMLEEAGVSVRYTDVSVFPDRTILFNGEPVSY